MEKYQFNREEQAILEGLKIPFAVYQLVNKHVVTIILSDGFCETFGYTDRKQAISDMDNNMYAGTHPDDLAMVEEASARFAEEGGEYDVVYRTKKKNDLRYHLVHSFGKSVKREDNVVLSYVWYSDEGLYTEIGRQDSTLENYLNDSFDAKIRMSKVRYDYLTGLPNMAYFFELVEVNRDAVLAEGGKPTMLFMDLCGLKFYNHRFGFENGNKFLLEFAKLLIELFGADNSCHIGQDHFAVFAPFDGLENRLNELFEKVKQLDNGDTVPVRVGVYYDDESSVAHPSVASDRAKIACDTLKGTFASAFCYYKHEQKENLIKKQEIIASIDNALKEKYIQVYYQPIVRTINGKVCDEEALSRWIDPVHGFMSPAEFIPALEESRLIYKLDLYVIEQVLEKIKNQKKAGLEVVPTSINISRSDFDVCDIVEEIRKRVDEAGINHEWITIELTESSISQDFEFMKKQIERFREMGFQVWMDDFGTGYSSLDVLQEIKFDLIKLDMSFMKKLDNDGTKVILTELLKMASSLGLETICEGVETEEQLAFLKETGCTKLQGYYFCKPISFDAILERYRKGQQIGFENAKEAPYFKAMGEINLNDISVLASEESDAVNNSLKSLPMGIIEVREDMARFVSSNRAYREFVKQYLGFDLNIEGSTFAKFSDAFMNNVVKNCCINNNKTFYDESMPDGSIVHSFARRIAVNPVNGDVAIAVAVLSISKPDEGATYANIARALAADYYNIYYVDLSTDDFIEYTSPVGGEDLAMERHGKNFFEECLEASERIFEEDRAPFFAAFSKEKVIRELDDQGVFNATYRVMDSGHPMYVSMKITRLMPNSDKIIIGISIIDTQMKHKEHIEEIKRERDAFARIMALSDNYLGLYTVDVETGEFVEYSSTKEYDYLDFAKHGSDFFEQSAKDAKRAIYYEDYPEFIKAFTRENVLKDIKEKGFFTIHYRLMIDDQPKPVSLRVAMIHEDNKEKLIAGVRAWRERN